MRVLVTGGTGFIGSHTVAALHSAKHEIRLLVRSPERIGAALAPHGIDPPSHVTGDITDPASVRRAVQGCDAVVHAAAVYDLDARAYDRTTRTNAPGARNVLEAAVAEGCDPIVHVSSTTVFIQNGGTATVNGPLTDLTAPYARSKVESELVARAFQRDGAPVVTIYPGGTYGPDDPALSDQMKRLRDVLRGLYPTWPRGGFHTNDVRDVARVIASTVETGRGPRAYAVPGHHASADLFFGGLRSVTGRRLPTAVLPPAVLRPVAFAGTALQRFVPFHIPAEHEGLVVTAADTRIDASATTADLGITATPWETTARDSVRWLHSAGHITARQAGTAVAGAV